MAKPKLLELAKQGNLDAIALLINRSLQSHVQSHPVTAKLIRHDRCLKILLEGAEVPPQSVTRLLQQGIEKLGIQTIDRLEIYGKQSNANTVTWAKTVQLGSPIAQPSTVSAFSQPAAPSNPVEPTPPKSCPRSYFVLALFTAVLAFLPLGIAALFFSRRVKPQYQQQNYEGAKSASETAKILCIVGICLASPFYIAIGFFATSYSLLITAYEKQIDRLYESQAKMAIESVNRSQQAYWLENNQFAISANQLQLTLQNNDRYQYQFAAIEGNRAIVAATAKAPRLKSFIGIVYATSAKAVAQSSDFLKAASLDSTICMSDAPIAPAEIRIEDDKVICPSQNE